MNFLQRGRGWERGCVCVWLQVFKRFSKVYSNSQIPNPVMRFNINVTTMSSSIAVMYINDGKGHLVSTMAILSKSTAIIAIVQSSNHRRLLSLKAGCILISAAWPLPIRCVDTYDLYKYNACGIFNIGRDHYSKTSSLHAHIHKGWCIRGCLL